MITDSDNGVDLQPISQNADKYADYLAMNPEDGDVAGTNSSDEGKSADKPVDVKPVEEPSTTTKQEHVPNWKRKIDKQTAKIRNLESELEQLRSKKVDAPKDKYTRDNFVSDAEYAQYEEDRFDKRVEDKLTARDIAERQRQLDTLKHDTDTEKFRSSWTENVNKHYGSDSQQLAEFSAIARDTEFLGALPDVVHDYMEGTDFGPVMMHVLFLRPDLVDRIANSKPVVQAKLLMKLESDIEQASSGAPSTQTAPVAQPATNRVSNAPAPIGVVGNAGHSTTDDEESDDATYARLLKKKLQNRGR